MVVIIYMVILLIKTVNMIRFANFLKLNSLVNIVSASVHVTLSHLRSKEITGTYISHVYLISMIPGLQLNINWFIFKCNPGS